MLAGALVAIPTFVWGRVGGRFRSYLALIMGVAVLALGELFRLVSVASPGWSNWVGTLASQSPIHAGGYLLVLVGFLSLMYDLRRVQTRQERATADEHDRAEAARLQEAKVRAVLNGATDYCIISCDRDGQVTSYSNGGARVLGWTAEDVVGRQTVLDLHGQARRDVIRDIMRVVDEQGHWDGEIPMCHKDGREVPVLLSVTPLTDGAGATVGYIGVAKDISDLKAAQDALRRERDFVRGLVETNELFILGTSAEDGRITMFNQGAERISGYSRDEVIGRRYSDVLQPGGDRRDLLEAIEQGTPEAFSALSRREHTITTRDGRQRVIAWNYTACFDAAGRPQYIVGFGHDVTDERRMQASLEAAKAELERVNAELQRLATTDYLTGLLNRRQGAALFEREIARSRRQGTPLAVILLDIDHFKVLNDSHGHEFGDMVLKHLAREMMGRLRATDIVARHGGEEFLVVLPETALEQAVRLAEQLRRRIQESAVTHGDVRVHMSSSFGVTILAPGEELAADELVRRADEAMYFAKNLGGNRVVTWERVEKGQMEPSLATSEEAKALESRIEALNRKNRDVLMDSLFALADDLETKSPYRRGHSSNMAQYAAAIAAEMDLSPEDTQLVCRAARLHDIGMAAVPPAVLGKNGPLSRADWSLVCQHPAAGVKVLQRLPFLQREVAVIRHHHERPDGRGYPDGLAGDAIPMTARILAVADALEAMTRDRPHRRAFTLEAALDQITSGAPQQFDAQVAAAAVAVARKTDAWPLVPDDEPVAVSGPQV